eukprot:CAMPEP_0206495044 /NCGR_PEP_ID=MMETSP0324_2-20121206/48173_1 /ASSEMBLY_ACC=CAM_ASM_000836 /TAXON_ID=2866 /ORGANISM="Crypthecodinium cohnii, Strain Seligo" /LENGTH=182 /DNA_ID=CAMNT_0053978983 /DNA_START=85 /DNA_END=630 /DNA_ORIENTATION=-
MSAAGALSISQDGPAALAADALNVGKQPPDQPTEAASAADSGTGDHFPGGVKPVGLTTYAGADAAEAAANHAAALAAAPAPQDEAPRATMDLRALAYSWDQEDHEVKIYVSFDQSEELAHVDPANVSVEFGEWSVLLVIKNADGSQRPPWGLRLGDFQKRIDPDRSTYAVRSSRISIKLRKQ